MKKCAFGLIDLLVGLLILTAAFMLGMSSFKRILPSNEPVQIINVREQIDNSVNEVELMRKNSVELQKEILKNEQSE